MRNSPLVQIYVPSRPLHSSLDDRTFWISTYNTKQHGHHVFCFTAAQIWNSLPFALLHSLSLPALKTSLKTDLFKQLFWPVIAFLLHTDWTLSLLLSITFCRTHTELSLSLFCSLSQLWNSLPFALLHSLSLPAFKLVFQTYLHCCLSQPCVRVCMCVCVCVCVRACFKKKLYCVHTILCAFMCAPLCQLWYTYVLLEINLYPCLVRNKSIPMSCRNKSTPVSS